MKKNAQLYFDHLDQVVGRKEDAIHDFKSSDPNLPPVSVILYKDWPEEGDITGFTYGLSAVEHPEWQPGGRAELMISVQSEDEAWCMVAGYLAETLRGKCAFSYGETINFRDQISEESEMDAFLIFAPPHLEREQMAVELNDFTIHLKGLYPLYSSELAVYEKLELEKFWNLPEFDPMNVHREPIKLRRAKK